MTKRRAFPLLLASLFAVALGMRLPGLGDRPFHADESVHAIKFDELRRTGRYVYDPNEYHGPTIYYAALPVTLLRGHTDFVSVTEADFRLTIAWFGAAMLLWLPLFAPGLGGRAIGIAAALFVLSPTFVYYGRYYIQETPLVFATLGLLACGWRYVRRPSAGWAIGVGICAGLMVASKETAVLTFGAATVAAFLTGRGRAVDFGPKGRFVALAAAAMIVTGGAFLSGFGTNPRGPIDLFAAFTPWLSRAHATDVHLHPWHYYLRLLIWPEGQKGWPMSTEILTVGLSFVGMAFAVKGARLVRFLAVYTLILTVGYGVIPYKTPWCVLSFLQGMILLAGVGASRTIERLPKGIPRGIASLGLLAGIAHLAWQTATVNYVHYNDPRNPYLYSPTAPETPQIAEKLLPIARSSPEGERVVIKVFSTDTYYWPLPWYLRRFPNVGFWVGVPPGTEADAPIVLASAAFDEELTQRLDATHLMTGFFALRPGVLMQTWVRLDLWQEYLKRNPVRETPDADGPP
ncbi:MAG: TIGR03663 family protein [Capsulimonadales bacterium]|nr:TIGR03663 family protein [Capsulimonadales bacterium]